MNNYITADEGKVFTLKNSSDSFYAKAITLGINDSIDNYIQVDESLRDQYIIEQEKAEKEAQLKALMLELYPPEEEG